MRVGQEMQDFEAEAYFNDDITKIRLSDYRGKWVVIIFYPADFTFVCPTELEEAADLYDEFHKEGAEILSVSTDTVFAHKAWHDISPAIKKIRFPMVADPTGRISRNFETYMDETGLSLRGSFVIDPDGVLKASEVNDIAIGRSGRELLRKLQAARFVRENNGMVCPAGWTPGKKGMKIGLDLVGKI